MTHDVPENTPRARRTDLLLRNTGRRMVAYLDTDPDTGGILLTLTYERAGPDETKFFEIRPFTPEMLAQVRAKNEAARRGLRADERRSKLAADNLRDVPPCD